MKVSLPKAYLPKSLSRRDFLRLGGTGLLGLFMPTTGWSESLSSPVKAFTEDVSGQLGRVIDERINIFSQPSFESKVVQRTWRDAVFPITTVTIGDEEPAYNRVWYRLKDDGFAHSGSIQPVQAIVNIANSQIPEDGAWGEVTVPFTDAYRAMGRQERLAYRFYYGTVHWVLALEYDPFGEAWYRVLDDKYQQFEYYVPAEHIRILSHDDLSLLSPDVPSDAKRIEVHTGPQVLIAYEYDQPVFMARTATGASLREGNFTTPPGQYFTYSKRAGRHMAAGDLASNGYDLPGVPWICYIIRGGLAIHGTYWHNDFGKTRSHGCVNLSPKAARWVYRWTKPFVPPEEQQVYVYEGTRVDVIGEEE